MFSAVVISAATGSLGEAQIETKCVELHFSEAEDTSVTCPTKLSGASFVLQHFNEYLQVLVCAEFLHFQQAILSTGAHRVSYEHILIK